jgi:uncharacterized protein involved in response to NO
VLLLGIADLLMWLELTPLEVPPGLGGRLGLALIVILMTVVAGRIVPAFTRNWLRRRGLEPSQAVGPGAIDSAARGLLLAGFLGFAFFPASQVVGVLLLAAAGFNLVRLARWGGWKTVAEPLLFILHVGYFWIVAGSALLGASLLTDAVPQPAAIHALTAGAIGTMILAVMTRVSLGHTGRPLEADFATTLIYALVTIAAVARICAAIHGGWAFLLDLSGAFWVASFALFALRYGPILIAPRPDGRAP